MSLPLRLFAVAAAAELVAVVAGWTPLQWIAKPLLAPLLIWYLARRTGRDPVLIGFAFAFAGDVALLAGGRTAFLVGMGCFLGAQLCLITAFLRQSRPSVLVMTLYGLMWLAVNAILWGQLGALRIPVLVYSLALAVMAATAAGVSWRVGQGGALFLFSDLLIGVSAASLRVPGHSFIVMVTYVLALYLIATGWVSARARSAPARAREVADRPMVPPAG